VLPYSILLIFCKVLLCSFQLYNLAEVAELVGLPSAFFIGPGAGSSRVVGKNCEVKIYIMPHRHHYLCVLSDHVLFSHVSLLTFYSSISYVTGTRLPTRSDLGVFL